MNLPCGRIFAPAATAVSALWALDLALAGGTRTLEPAKSKRLPVRRLACV